jgi:hypothetical protein
MEQRPVASFCELGNKFWDSENVLSTATSTSFSRSAKLHIVKQYIPVDKTWINTTKGE